MKPTPRARALVTLTVAIVALGAVSPDDAHAKASRHPKPPSHSKAAPLAAASKKGGLAGLGRPYYDKGERLLVLPYHGAEPSYTRGSLKLPPRVYFDFDEEAAGVGILSEVVFNHPSWVGWAMAPHGPHNAQTRVTLIFKQSTAVAVTLDAHRHALLLMPGIDYQAGSTLPLAVLPSPNVLTGRPDALVTPHAATPLPVGSGGESYPSSVNDKYPSPDTDPSMSPFPMPELAVAPHPDVNRPDLFIPPTPTSSPLVRPTQRFTDAPVDPDSEPVTTQTPSPAPDNRPLSRSFTPAPDNRPLSRSFTPPPQQLPPSDAEWVRPVRDAGPALTLSAPFYSYDEADSALGLANHAEGPLALNARAVFGSYGPGLSPQIDAHVLGLVTTDAAQTVHAREEWGLMASVHQHARWGGVDVKYGLGYLVRYQATPGGVGGSVALAPWRAAHGPVLAAGLRLPVVDASGWAVRLEGSFVPILASALPVGLPALPWLWGYGFEVGVQAPIGPMLLGAGYRRTGFNGEGYAELYQGPFLSLSL